MEEKKEREVQCTGRPASVASAQQVSVGWPLTLAALPPAVRVVDLSADFRLRNVETYAEWHGGPHH